MEHHVATSAEHSTEFFLQHVVKLTVLVSQLCAKSGVLDPLKQKAWLTNKVLRQEPPWVVKMMGFQEKKERNIEWFSDFVFSHFGGYKMCLRVDANDGKGTHVSVYVCLMRGDNDDNLKWPFKGTVEVSCSTSWRIGSTLEDSCGLLMLISLKTPVNVSQWERELL